MSKFPDQPSGKPGSQSAAELGYAARRPDTTPKLRAPEVAPPEVATGYDMQRTGKCMCGAVSYTAEIADSQCSACHCGMCRRWTGGPLLAVSAKDIQWQGEDSLATIASSDWAERGFCSKCGSGLYWRITAPGRFEGATSVPLGTLDDQSGLTLSREWFIDKKPDAYALAGEHRCVTEAEAFAMLNGGQS